MILAFIYSIKQTCVQVNHISFPMDAWSPDNNTWNICFSDRICCDFTEAVIRLAVSALVGMRPFAIWSIKLNDSKQNNK